MTTTYADHAIVQNSGNDFLQYKNSSGAVLYSISSTGATSTQNGLALAGQGQPGIVYALNNAALGFATFNAAVAVTMVASATANAGTYRISLYGVTTTTFVTNTEETITFGYTDDDQAQTIAITTTAKTAGTVTPAATAPNSWIIRSTGAAAITWTPAVTGSNATAGVMALSIICERLV